MSIMARLLSTNDYLILDTKNYESYVIPATTPFKSNEELLAKAKDLAARGEGIRLTRADLNLLQKVTSRLYP